MSAMEWWKDDGTWHAVVTFPEDPYAAVYAVCGVLVTGAEGSEMDGDLDRFAYRCPDCRTKLEDVNPTRTDV